MAAVYAHPLAALYMEPTYSWDSDDTYVGQQSAFEHAALCAPAVVGGGEAGNAVATQPWDPLRFELVSKLMDAVRNSGQVLLMYDHLEGRHVAGKRIPNEWICTCAEEFALEHPEEVERPWVDIFLLARLNASSFPYACGLVGVFRDDSSTYVVTELASEGDLFTFCGSPSGISEDPGLVREARMLPIIMQILDSVRRLHCMGIAHGDLSLENILLTRCGAEGELAVRVIDFGMSTLNRFRTEVVGKPSYQAPEMDGCTVYDGFQADAFSLGIVFFALLMRDYPWASTRPGECRCFTAFRVLGFRRFVAKRPLRGSKAKVIERMSEPMARLLEGLLAVDPEERLSLFDTAAFGCGTERATVWQDPLVQCFHAPAAGQAPGGASATDLCRSGHSAQGVDLARACMA